MSETNVSSKDVERWMQEEAERRSRKRGKNNRQWTRGEVVVNMPQVLRKNGVSTPTQMPPHWKSTDWDG